MEKPNVSTLAPPLAPFILPHPAGSLKAWSGRIWQDLQPTPGRLSNSLRIVLATIITLLAVLVLQVPYASVALYFVFFVGRESPAVSLRSLLMLVPIVAAVATELAIVILTDNNPMARVLGMAAVSFLAGLIMVGTTQPPLGSTWAFVFATLIAFWESPAPAGRLVTLSLWVISALSIPILSSIAVEYVFGARHPAELLSEQISTRWRALIAMFSLFAEQATPEKRAEAVTLVSRLAGTGQEGMQELYNKIVERNLDTGSLKIGARVRITMLAELMDLAAAVGSAPYADDPASLLRYRRFAAEAEVAFKGRAEAASEAHEFRIGANPGLLDQVEGVLHSIRSMPMAADVDERKLVALPAKKVPLLIPGGFTNPANVAFALKISLCATICYVLYHAIDYPGISTCVITVFITGLTTTGAIKQKFVLRLVGSLIGGFIFGLGAAVFLFPNMDSVTSLVVLIAVIAFIGAWCAQGRRFGYAGMQIVFSFYLVAFEGFSAPTHLAPPRDRLIGILLALVVMWFVFDQIWPVRTVTAMRRALATILRDGAKLFRLSDAILQRDGGMKDADALRDQVGKTIADLRTLNDAVEYEFGPDRDLHMRLSNSILRTALTAVALFWNEMVILHHKPDRELLADGQVIQLRHEIAVTMDAIADAVAQPKAFVAPDASRFVDPSLFAKPRYKEYARNALTRFRELQDYIRQIGVAG